MTSALAERGERIVGIGIGEAELREPRAKRADPREEGQQIGIVEREGARGVGRGGGEEDGGHRPRILGIHARLLEYQILEEEAPARDDPQRGWIEGEILGCGEPIVGNPSALDGGGEAHEGLARAGVDVDPNEELGVGDGARVGEARAASPTMTARRELCLAAAGEAVGEGGEQRAEDRLVAGKLGIGGALPPPANPEYWSRARSRNWASPGRISESASRRPPRLSSPTAWTRSTTSEDEW